MDLSFTPEEQAFAAEIREWLAANLELPPRFETRDDEIAWGRQWQARLAADRWVGIHWPSEYGGRGASPIEVAIYNMEYARARAPQPVNRVGVNNVGPTLLAFGTDEQKGRWLPAILDASDAWWQPVSEAGARSRPRGRADARGPGRGRLDAQRAEGVDELRAVVAVGDLPRSHRPRRAEARGHLVPRRRHGGRRHRDPSARAAHGGGGVQRGVPRRGLRAGGPACRWPAPGLVGREHDAVARARHDLRLQGAGRARGVPRRALRARRT